MKCFAEKSGLHEVKKPRLIEAFDADLHANNLSRWQQKYDQMSRGTFYGSIVETSLTNLQVFKEHTSKALVQTCCVWPDSFWLGIPAPSRTRNSTSRINGIIVENNCVMCRPGSCEFELITPEHFDIYGIVVRDSILEVVANQNGIEIKRNQWKNQTQLRIPFQTKQMLSALLSQILSELAHNTPEYVMHDLIMTALLEVLQKKTTNDKTLHSFRHRKIVVDRVKDHINQNRDKPVTITELCQVGCVSRRTLQYSFETIMGISPFQYLRYSRLNGVRRTLCSAPPTWKISDIAAAWGFWHLSQFAKDYRILFGESPSSTLEKNSCT